MAIGIEKPASIDGDSEDYSAENGNEIQNYTPEDLENLENAKNASLEIVEWALEQNSTNRQVVETSEGTRGYIHNTFNDGNVEALFDDDNLRQMNINLENGEDTKTISIIGLEDSEQPKIYLEGKLVNIEEIPAVRGVVESIQSEIAGYKTLPEVPEDDIDNEKETDDAQGNDEEINEDILGELDDNLGSKSTESIVDEESTTLNQSQTDAESMALKGREAHTKKEVDKALRNSI